MHIFTHSNKIKSKLFSINLTNFKKKYLAFNPKIKHKASENKSEGNKTSLKESENLKAST